MSGVLFRRSSAPASKVNSVSIKLDDELEMRDAVVKATVAALILSNVVANEKKGTACSLF